MADTPRCCVRHCPFVQDVDGALFPFPDDEGQRATWLYALNYDIGSENDPKFVCHHHFETADLEDSVPTHTAVPSKYLDPRSNMNLKEDAELPAECSDVSDNAILDSDICDIPMTIRQCLELAKGPEFEFRSKLNEKFVPRPTHSIPMKPQKKRIRMEKIHENQQKIEWLENKVLALEETCLHQKLLMAKLLAIIGQAGRVS